MNISRRELQIWVLAFVIFGLPMLANAGVADMLLVLKNIYGTLRRDIGGTLLVMRDVNKTAQNLEQQVLWPETMMNQTRALLSRLHVQLGGAATQILRIPVSSASLPNSQSLESVLRGGRISAVGNIGLSYTRVFQPVPNASDAHAQARSLVDVDDAVAIGSLKSAVIADRASERMQAVAGEIETQTTTTAPGTAAFAGAEAEVANIQSEAFIQRLLAAELREEAAQLAHTTALKKQRARATKSLGSEIQGILSH